MCCPRPRTDLELLVRTSDEHMNTSISYWKNQDTEYYVLNIWNHIIRTWYVRVLCVRADPVSCSRARWRRGNDSREMSFFSTVLVCTGSGKSRIPQDITHGNGKPRGMRTFHGNWMGAGCQDFFGNCLDGITGTIFAREQEKTHFPWNHVGN